MERLDKKRVVLGMSGGVDSATAALLLKEQGFQVTAFWFDVLSDNKKGLDTAREAAEQLGIDFYWKDVSKEFENIVIRDFCTAYLEGKTPNPCVVCNPAVKFRNLLKTADETGAYYIATGHYAKVWHDESTGLWHIKKAANEKKDQSYMLYRLGQEVLSRLLLPLEGFSSKKDVRFLARENNLQNADLKDSQEICFLPAGKSYADYIRDRGCQIKKGYFIDTGGRVLAEHQGLIHYTIGQRKGLGVTFGKPMFVTKLSPKDNTVTLASNEELFTDTVVSGKNYFPGNGDRLPEALNGAEVFAKIRYTSQPARAVLMPLGDGRIRTVFFDKQRAVTPGQSIVFYQKDIVVGGGIIEGE